MKSRCGEAGRGGVDVAPLAGAWIEIYTMTVGELEEWVAPLAGAWIEMRSPPDRGSAP